MFCCCKGFYNSSTLARQIISTEETKLVGRTALITGATSGIGVETAKVIALTGATVCITCRDMDRGKTVAATIGPDVEVYYVDFEKLSTVKDFINEFSSKHDVLDVLINNAGVFGNGNFIETEDHFEKHLQVNAYAPFYMTIKLLPLLLKSRFPRVVFLSSLAHAMCNPFFSLRPSGCFYTDTMAYSNSKMLILLLSKQLSRRSTKIHFYAVHPGVIDTNLFKNIPCTQCCMCMKTIEQGAATTIYCAVSSLCAQESGKYYRDCASAITRPDAYLHWRCCFLFNEVCRMLDIDPNSLAFD